MRPAITGWGLCAPHPGAAGSLLSVNRHWTPDATSRFTEITLYTPRPIDRHALAIPSNIRERVLSSSWPMLLWENTRLAAASRDEVVFCPSFSRPLLLR